MQIQNGSRSWTWEMRPPRVLIAESDDSSRAEVCRALIADGYDVVEAHDGYEVLDSILAFPPGPTDCIDVIVVSCRLPGCDGTEVLDRVRRMQIQTPFVVVGERDEVLTGPQFDALMKNHVMEIEDDLDQIKGAVHRLTHAF